MSPLVTVATWNVNSVNARLANVVAWLERAAPDIVLLQEIKCQDDAFPRAALEKAGYASASHGQKSYNGVAILARSAIEDVTRGLPGAPEDDQARYIEATVAGVRVASIYLPNGNPAGGEKFTYKLAWMRRLAERTRELVVAGAPTVLGGDYNVIPERLDARHPERWVGDALFRPETRRAFRALCHQGLTEAFRALHPSERAFSFWDYQGGAWQTGDGIRIDHLLLSPSAADRLERAWIDKQPRGEPKASDHTPVLVELRDP